MLKIGDKAPDFNLPDENGKMRSLSELNNKKLVLFFFPKASTPGWTIESQGFRDEFETFKNRNIEVVGVSADPISKQKKFVEKYNFQFPMLCDESHEMLESYKVWGKKKFMGKEYMGINRYTYVIDEEGLIERSYEKVKTKTHAQDVLNDCKI